MFRQNCLAGSQMSEAQAWVMARFSKRVASMAHDVMSMPLKSVAKERHQECAASMFWTVTVVCMAAGHDLQACQGEPRVRHLALLGLAACPHCLHLEGRRWPLASELRLLSAEVVLHLLHQKV